MPTRGREHVNSGFDAELAHPHELKQGERAHEQGQPDSGKKREERIVPARRAFGAWRPVAAARLAAGIAESHRHDGDAGGVVEGLGFKREPVAKARSRGVVPGDTGFVNAGSGRLADDQKPR